MVFYSFTDDKASHSEQHNAAHKLLASALKKLYGIEKYTLSIGEHGKPYLTEYPQIHFNLSHCTGLVVCGISESEIGIDAELIRPYIGKGSKRIFTLPENEYISKSKHPDESFFRIWTLKECLGKALGTGLTGISKYEFDLSAENPICSSFPEKHFTQIILQKKWVISICADNPIFINRNVFCF